MSGCGSYNSDSCFCGVVVVVVSGCGGYNSNSCCCGEWLWWS